MSVGTEMFLEVYGRQKLMVQTECHLAECSRTLRLPPETSNSVCCQVSVVAIKSLELVVML